MPKVVIADDEEFVRCFLKSLLKSISYDVVGEVGTGSQLLQTIPKIKPDILLLDINMPDLTGIEFLEKYSHLYPQTCVIILTSRTLSELINENGLSRANCFLNKSTPVAQMIESIQRTWEYFKQEKHQ